MKTFFSLIILIFTCLLQSKAQEIIISGKKENRPLTWADFTGTPDNSSPYSANTFWNISYSYSNTHADGNKISLEDFVVVLSLIGDNSWIKKDKMSTDLLKHEQGHFNIAILCQLDILNQVKNTVLHKKDFKDEVRMIFRNTIQKYTEVEDKYDTETMHSADAKKQAEWNIFIAAEHERLLKQN